MTSTKPNPERERSKHGTAPTLRHVDFRCETVFAPYLVDAHRDGHGPGGDGTRTFRSTTAYGVDAIDELVLLF